MLRGETGRAKAAGASDQGDYERLGHPPSRTESTHAGVTAHCGNFELLRKNGCLQQNAAERSRPSATSWTSPTQRHGPCARKREFWERADMSPLLAHELVDIEGYILQAQC